MSKSGQRTDRGATLNLGKAKEKQSQHFLFYSVLEMTLWMICPNFSTITLHSLCQWYIKQ